MPLRSAVSALVVVVSSLTAPVLAQEDGASVGNYGVADKRETFGAVMAPAALPSGSNAAYLFLGVQEVGAGYRQGISALELEARARFNYLLLALGLEAVLKVGVLRGDFELAPYLGAGVVLNTGARYFEPANFAHIGLKLLGGATATYRFTDTLRGVANVEIPYDLSLTASGSGQFNPLVGVGGELYLGEDVSALLLGSIGANVLKEPLGVPVVRLGYQLRLGLGYRFF